METTSIKKGDPLLCIKEASNLTVGTAYTVQDYYHHTTVVGVLNDKGSVSHYFLNHFIKLIEQPIGQPMQKEVEEVKSETRKILGWKIKNEFYWKAAANLVGSTQTKSDFLSCMEVAGDYSWARYLRTAGVLDLWFEPVYKEDKPTFVTLTLGNKNDKVTVVRGSQNIECRGIRSYTTLDRIRVLYDLTTGKAPAHSCFCKDAVYIYVPTNERYIRIGCIEGDHTFSPDELKEIIDAWETLNKE